jgi:hypothetical protein
MKKIKTKEYFRKTDISEYDLILKHLKPKDNFNGKKLNFSVLTYKDVRSCIYLLNNLSTIENIEQLFCLAFGIDADTFWNSKVQEFYACRNYLIKKFKDVQERESKLLQSIGVDSGLWMQAGGKKLDKFSNIMPLIQLGEIYGIYPYDLQCKPYEEILLLLVAHKEKSEVQNEYSRLKNK